jgi:hypothetical protein
MMENYTFFCPNPDCSNHYAETDEKKWFIKKGCHQTAAFGKVQRYICKSCNRGFSDQTFSLNYYLKINTDFRKLFDQFNSSNSDCFTARHFDMSFDSLQIRRHRMARNALFFQSKVLEGVNIGESLCADGLETYTKSKYYPVNINVLMGRETRFLYYFTESHQRRKGQMTKGQKIRIETEYQDKSFSGSVLRIQFKKIIDFISEKKEKGKVFLYTDEHKTYKTIIDEWNINAVENPPYIEHHQTNSKAPRTKDNPLAAGNYIDRLIRKDQPNHRRKTICKARNDRNMLSRMTCYMFSHNFLKPVKILSRRNQIRKRHFHGTGINENSVQDLKGIIFSIRMFISKVSLPEFYEEIWFKKTATPLLSEPDYLPKFAAA